MNDIFFSVIVVSYNAQDSIRRTIMSVLNQTYKNYEIIVKDGLSKDNTLSEIPKSDKIKVYSMKDSGIYAAMNDALEYCSGDYMTFLNCGDVFYNENVLHDINMLLSDYTENSIVVYGDHVKNGMRFKQYSNVTDYRLYRGPLCHQSMFFAKKVFTEVGKYDINYTIAADYDLTVHCYKMGYVFLYCDFVVCDYLAGGFSEKKVNAKLKKFEFDKIHKMYFSLGKRILFGICTFLSLRNLRKFLANEKMPKSVQVFYRKFVNALRK